MKNLKGVLIAIALAVGGIGCASFPGKELPKYSYEQIKPPSPKPSIGYDAKFLTMGRENARAVIIFQEEIEKVFGQSKFFQKYGPGVGLGDYHFSMVLQNEGNLCLAGISGFISGITLTLIPGYAKDEFVLIVDVKKENHVLKQYQYKHYMDTWIQLFMVFLTATHNPKDVSRQVIDDMLLNFLHDLEKDQILVQSPKKWHAFRAP